MSRPGIDQQITFLYTRDLARTARFYEEVLELPLALDQGGCRIYRVNGEAYLGFCERESAPERPQGEHLQNVLFTLVTQEVDAWYAYLHARGVPFDKTPAVDETYGIYHCFARDPNGYVIEIQRFLDANWNSRR
jgi:catechol 2,3-dioxygenase-like lactoylglutathione lyase family enzyme